MNKKEQAIFDKMLAEMIRMRCSLIEQLADK